MYLIPRVAQFHLTKVVEHWNIKPGDGYVYFTLRPRWVKYRPTDTFYTLHPEQRLFRVEDGAAA